MFDRVLIFEAVEGRELCSARVEEVLIVGDDKKIVNSYENRTKPFCTRF